MKIKGFICVILILLLVFLIHLKTSDHDIYYLNLSIDKNNYSYDNSVKDYLEEENKLEKFISDFTLPDDRVTDLIISIKDNKSVLMNSKKQTIQNALIKADLVTVFIGLNDINYKIGYNNIEALYDYGDTFIDDLEKLLELLRKYCKENIILIGYYNSFESDYDKYVNYINKESKKVAQKYNIEFIDVTSIYKIDNYRTSIWMTKEEHEILGAKIKKYIDTKILK